MFNAIVPDFASLARYLPVFEAIQRVGQSDCPVTVARSLVIDSPPCRHNIGHNLLQGAIDVPWILDLSRREEFLLQLSVYR